MAYVVLNEKGRKEFESMIDAQEFIKESVNSRVYESDSFGNPTKLSQDDITIRINDEKKAKGLVEEKPRQEKEDVFVKIKPEEQAENEEPPENEKMSPILKYGLIAIAGIIVLAVVFFMIVPLFQQFLDAFNSV
jgi:hypothetical protein